MEQYTIRHGAWSATVNVSRGANCISLRREDIGAQILREPTYAAGEHPFLFGMPLLFPVNRISGGCFSFEGRTYRFPVNEPDTGCHLHGELHAVPFTVIARGEDFLRCAYRADGAHPYGAFPHEFEILLEYRLDEEGLTQRTQVTNHSSQNMPCLLGFHTTFRVPFIDGGKVLVGAQIREEYERDATYLPTGVTPAPDRVTEALMLGHFDPLSCPISRHCRAGGEGRMTLTDVRNGVRVVYENDASLAFRLIYNGDANGFICMEPQNCLVDAPNNVFGRDRSGFDAIAPGESRVYRSRICLETESSC